MSRLLVPIIALLLTAVSASIATLLVVGSNQPRHIQLSNEQQLTRQNFFSSGDKLPPIEKGQEIQPRW